MPNEQQVQMVALCHLKSANQVAVWATPHGLGFSGFNLTQTHRSIMSASHIVPAAKLPQRLWRPSYAKLNLLHSKAAPVVLRLYGEIRARKASSAKSQRPDTASFSFQTPVTAIFTCPWASSADLSDQTKQIH
jgi:hypothetical protein